MRPKKVDRCEVVRNLSKPLILDKTNKKAAKPKIATYARIERRYFTEYSRKAIVKEIDEGFLTVKQASKKYSVTSRSIYNWLNKYSYLYQTKLVKVIEHKSDSKDNKTLKKELAKAYELLGKTGAKVAFLEKIIEEANAHYQTDIKKTFGNNASNISMKTNKPK